jgi:hypothetical protein
MVVDGATERVLDSKMFSVGNGALTPRVRNEFENRDRLVHLTGGWKSRSQRARGKPLEALDIRDLSFRAKVEWNGKKRAARPNKGLYTTATDLLNRALKLAPDDLLALKLTAQGEPVRLRRGLVERTSEEQQAIGAAAIDKLSG